MLLTCPKIHPVVKSKAPASRPKDKGSAKPALAPPSTGLLAPPPPAGGGVAGASLTGAVDISSIVPSADKPSRSKQEAEALKPVLGPDFDEETDVPPLL